MPIPKIIVTLWKLLAPRWLQCRLLTAYINDRRANLKEAIQWYEDAPKDTAQLRRLIDALETDLYLLEQGAGRNYSAAREIDRG